MSGGNRHGIHKTETVHGVRWHAKVNLGLDPLTGRRRVKRLTADTRKALEAKIAAAIEQAAKPPDPHAELAAMPLSEFLDQWLQSASGRVKGSTMRTWRSRCDAWIVPVLGQVPLKDLTPLHVERLMQTILAAGRSPSLANVVHATLRSALTTAKRWRLITSNPCSDVTPPRVAAPEMRTWTAQEARRAIAHTAEDRQIGALIRLALTTGMRMGELLGLRWQDVDLEARTVAVRQTIVRGAGGKPTISTPKTPTSRRVIVIAPDDVTALRHHRAMQVEGRLALGAAWQDHDLVFPGQDGAPIHPNSLTKRFERLIRDAALPRIRFHDLRHTHASLLLLAGTHVKVVSERLGHASSTITMDRYSHLMPSMQTDAALHLEAILEQSEKTDGDSLSSFQPQRRQNAR